MPVPKNKVILSRQQREMLRMLQERMATIVASMKARQAEVNQIFVETVELYRKEHEVPKDWMYDMEEMAFNPPNEGGESDG